MISLFTTSTIILITMEKNPNHYPGSDSQTLAYLKDSDGWSTPAKRDLLKRISDWLKGVLDNLDIVVAIVPGHSPQSPPNFLHPIIGNFIRGNVKDGRDLLIRTREVPKAAHGGPRSQSLHEETIKVTDPSKLKSKIKWFTLLMIYGPLVLPFELVQV